MFKRARAALEGYVAAGAAPEKLALAAALGITCGLFPFFGTTTALAALVAVVFRANMIVVQVFNYLMYPVYLPCVVLMFVAGAWAFGSGHEHYTSSMLYNIAAQGLRASIQALGLGMLHAIYVWIVLAPILVVVLRVCLLPPIRRWTDSRQKSGLPSSGPSD